MSQQPLPTGVQNLQYNAQKKKEELTISGLTDMRVGFLPVGPDCQALADPILALVRIF